MVDFMTGQIHPRELPLVVATEAIPGLSMGIKAAGTTVLRSDEIGISTATVGRNRSGRGWFNNSRLRRRSRLSLKYLDSTS